MHIDWIEAVGYAGTALTILAYGMRSLVPLRIAGILSSLAFLSYGLLTHSYPLVLMESLLLPINLFRLLELRAANAAARSAAPVRRNSVPAGP